ncbi:Holliday junction branch migration protein RuvA [bacterium]|nr:Holliday junction branch migration protein RuvA [bacterium]
MISFVEGLCVYIGKGKVVLENNGLGYDISVTEALADRCTLDRTYRLHTQLVVRDNELELIGFSTPLEREFFKLLTSISGIGPKAALKILSILPPSELSACILEGNVDSLKQVPGVGVKTAKRIILELQEKISQRVDTSSYQEKSEDRPAGNTPHFAEALDILISLGCRSEEAEGFLKAAQEKISAEGAEESADLLVFRAMGEMGGQ